MYKRVSDSGLDVQANYYWIAVLYPRVKGAILAIENINVQRHLLIGGFCCVDMAVANSTSGSRVLCTEGVGEFVPL